MFQGRIALPVILTTSLTSPPKDVYNSTDKIQPSDSLIRTVCVGCDIGSLLFVVVFVLQQIANQPHDRLQILKKIRRHFKVTSLSLICVQDLLQEVKQLKKKVEELEGEKGQYERKLRGTKVCDESSARHTTPPQFVYVGAIKISAHAYAVGAGER